MKIIVDRNLPFAERDFAPLGEVTAIETAAFTPAAVRDADALVIRSETKVGPALLEGSRVRFVGTASIGVDHLDAAYLASRGIALANAPGCNSNSVKEYVAAALLEAACRLGFSLRGKTLGVVGVGAVGSKVAQAAEILGLNVLLNDPPLARTTGDSKYAPLDALMDADILTLHVPLTKTGADPTFHLFDGHRLDRLKPGCLFINSSRGAVVETAALKTALDQGRIRAAVLDVWEGEPAIDAALVDRALLATAHAAGYSMEGKLNAVRMVRAALAGHFRLDPLRPVGPLPASAEAREIVIPAEASSDEDILRAAVRAAYDISMDDGLLRAANALPEAERPAAFARLRAGYRVRREFPAWTVRLSSARASAGSVLAALGFKVIFSSGRVLISFGPGEKERT
jgi:erythronate-4-phosphate dehydrogenase